MVCLHGTFHLTHTHVNKAVKVDHHQKKEEKKKETDKVVEDTLRAVFFYTLHGGMGMIKVLL